MATERGRPKHLIQPCILLQGTSFLVWLWWSSSPTCPPPLSLLHFRFCVGGQTLTGALLLFAPRIHPTKYHLLKKISWREHNPEPCLATETIQRTREQGGFIIYGPKLNFSVKLTQEIMDQLYGILFEKILSFSTKTLATGSKHNPVSNRQPSSSDTEITLLT